jgi:alkylation response protein AidB-like acyl-CoA dehydrogenase
MDFRKTEEQELLLESIRELVERNVPENYIKECDEKCLPLTKLQEALIESGFIMIGIPEEYGGTPVDVTTMVLIGELLSSLGVGHSMLSNALQVDDALSFCSPEQQKIIMHELLTTGQNAFCLGITEPQAGSDNSAIATTAVRRGDGKVVINGHKCFITNADRAPYMMCVAHTENPSDSKHQFSMWLVPMNSPGIKIEHMQKVGIRMSTLCDVYLEDVVVEEKDLMGKDGYGFIQLMKNFEVERLIIAASSLGMAEGAYNDAVAYANQRVQFGKPIGSFQLIQEKIVRMAIKLENMKNIVYKTAWEKDNNLDIGISSALAKLYCSEAAFEVCDDAMQIFGGIGYTAEHRVSRFWRDSRMHRIGGGTNEIMVHVAGRAILKKHK